MPTISSTKFKLFNRQVLKVFLIRFCVTFDNISCPLGPGVQVYVHRAHSSGRYSKSLGSLPRTIFPKPYPSTFHIDVFESLPSLLYLHFIH